MTKTRINKLAAAFLAVVMTIAFYGYMPRNIAHAESQADAIVSIALAEEGYTEGSNNNNKYGAALGQNNVAWCALFISWCARQAGIPTSIIKTTAWAGDMGSSKQTGNFGGQYYPKGSITPQKGDIVYYDWNRNGSSDHVEIVISTSGSTFTSIGGNTKGDSGSTEGVRRHSNYSFTSSYVVGFERPNYNGSANPPAQNNDDELGIPYPRPQVSSTVWLGKNGITSGDYVRWLQTALNKADNAGLAVDGQFGSGTTTAVKNFQAKYGLTQDGQAGTATINKLVEVIKNKLNPPAPSIKIKCKIWMSDNKMGNEVSSFETGKWYYMCYKLYDEYTGKLISETSARLNDYKITETIYNPDGSIFNTCTYDNSDNNWIGIKPSNTGSYKWELKLTITKTDSTSIAGSGEFNVTHTHSYGSWSTTKSATCMSDGSEKRTCSVCGQSETRTVSATGHSYNSKIIPPTNTEKGYTLHTCSKCGSNYKDNFTDVLVFEFIASESSVNINIDKNEKKSITFSYKNIPSSIEYVNVQVENGDNPVVNLEWGKWENHAIPLYFSGYRTGTENVTVKLYDAGTKEVLATKTIKVTVSECNHSFDSWSTTKESTCTGAGIKSRKCTICGKTETESMSPTGHSWSEWEIVKEATCIENGETKRECSKCDTTESVPILSTMHKYESITVVPTYTEKGYVLHKCSVCGNSYKDNYTDKLVKVQGDANTDGKFDVADVILLQKWLLAVPDTKLADWKAADLCEDGRLDVFDLCMMKRMLVNS